MLPVTVRSEDRIDGEDRPGGCPLKAAAIELDDQPGPLRDTLKASQVRWAKVLKREFRTINPNADDATLEVLVFQFKGIVLAYGHSRRLLDDDTARAQATALEQEGDGLVAIADEAVTLTMRRLVLDPGELDPVLEGLTRLVHAVRGRGAGPFR